MKVRFKMGLLSRDVCYDYLNCNCKGHLVYEKSSKIQKKRRTKK